MSPKRMNNKGFSLVELIIVVVIIAVLAVLMAPSLSGRLEKAKRTACYADCATLERELSYAALSEAPDGNVVQWREIMERVLAERGDLKCPSGGTYTCNAAGNGISNVYCSVHSDGWVKGKKFIAGETMVSGTDSNLVFRCLKTHVSGSRSNTRDPSVKSNKGSWELIGTADGSVPAYNSTVRFAVGSLCTYNGNYYSRTTYNLTGGQTPYSKSSSRYWILEGPITP